jgi:fructuronate reductase/mannitol 2-dehydrogenase
MSTTRTGRGPTRLRPPPLLRRSALASSSPALVTPSYDPRDLAPGVVHLGVGGFHRAHQAAYLHRLAQNGARDWGVVGVGVRSGTMREDLLAQDCLYTLTELGAEGRRVEVVGVHKDYLSQAQQPARVRRALDDPRTRLVTVTVTAPTYADPGAGGAVFGLIARALERRRRAGREPFAVLSCDNLPRNGDSLRRCVTEAAGSAALAAWIETHVAFPNSMVDRITPPTPSGHRRELRERLGLWDRAAVVTERYCQWVLEDALPASRPPLEDVGVQLVSDVAPYVELKTRVLNAGHLALGFLGTGLATTDRAMADPVVGRSVHRMLAEQVLPLLPPVPGTDVSDYLLRTEARFASQAVADPLDRLRRRASVRFRNYLWPSIDAAVAAGAPYDLLLEVVAAWLGHLRQCAAHMASGSRTRREVLEELSDPAGEALLLAARRVDDVREFLDVAGAPRWLSQHEEFVARLSESTVEEPSSDAVA